MSERESTSPEQELSIITSQIKRIFKKQSPLPFPAEEFRGHIFVGTLPEDDAFVDFPQHPYYNTELCSNEQISMDPRRYYRGEAEIPALDTPDLSADGLHIKDGDREPASIQAENKESQKNPIAIPHIIIPQEKIVFKTKDGDIDPEEFLEVINNIREQTDKVLVGQKEDLELTITCIIAQGHALLEGLPGIGKTLLVKTLSDVMNVKFSRIQFTPDLMPADITGTNIYVKDDQGGGKFRFDPGPVFANLVLADEINRATPKTQAALLEAMNDKTVTAFKETYPLEEPFFVLATQNPLEIEGTYTLPEAQIDRFFFKLLMPVPSKDEYSEIIRRNTGEIKPKAEKITDGQTIIQMQKLARCVPLADHVIDYIARLAHATHPGSEYATQMVNKHVRYGVSPRAGETVALAAKIEALKRGGYNVSFEDVRKIVHPAFRHRLISTFESEVSGTSNDTIIDDILEKVPEYTKE